MGERHERSSTRQETLIESRPVYAGTLIALDVDRLRLPGGMEIEREVVRHPGGVVLAPILPDGRLLLVRQFRHSVGEALWELPAGTLEQGEESLVACAHRELEEETGYRAGRLTPLGDLFTAPGFTDERLHIFLAEDLHFTGSRPEPDELISVAPFTWEELRSRVHSGEIRDAKTLAALYLLALRPGGP